MIRASFDVRELRYTRAVNDWSALPPLQCASAETRELRFTWAMIAWPPFPNLRAMIHASYGARERGYTRAMVAGPFLPPILRAVMHASYDCVAIPLQIFEQ